MAPGRNLVKINRVRGNARVNLNRGNRSPANRSRVRANSRVRASPAKVRRVKASRVKGSKAKPRTAPSRALDKLRPGSRAPHRMEESGIAVAPVKYIRITGWSKAIANRCAI